MNKPPRGFPASIALIALALLFGFTLWACTAKPELEPAPVDFAQADPTASVDPNTPKEVPDNVEVTEVTGSMVRLNPANIYEADETVTDGGLNFSQVRATATQTLPSNVQKEMFIYFNDDKLDADGSLPTNRSYLFATVSVANSSQAPVEYFGNSCKFLVADDTLAPLGDATELRYISTATDVSSKGYSRFSLAPGETKNIVFGYVIDKAALGSGTLYFVVDSTGSAPFGDDPQEVVYLSGNAFKIDLVEN